jgi:hypothetical protein
MKPHSGHAFNPRPVLISSPSRSGALCRAGRPRLSAQAKSFYWERFDVDVEVLPNGDLIVTENQTLNFSGGTFRAGFRTIPTGRAGNNDGLDNFEVLEGTSATPRTARSSRIRSTSTRWAI